MRRLIPWLLAALATAVLAQSTTLTLTWTASTANGDPITYAVEDAASSAGPFTALASGLTALTYSTAYTAVTPCYEVVATDTKDSLTATSNVACANSPSAPVVTLTLTFSTSSSSSSSAAAK